MRYFILALSIAVLFTVNPLHFSAQAEDGDGAIELPPIRIMGTPSDVLLADPLVPAVEGRVSHQPTGQGNLGRVLQNETGLPGVDYGRVGSISQLRGFGSSSDDLNVQVLGIPLNGPQGGGFDFSSFPQFLWSDFRMDLGPSSAGYDPRSVSGTVTLTPWSARAIDQSHPTYRGELMVSSADLRQYSLAASAPQLAAGAFVFSDGKSRGPSLSLSAHALHRGPVVARFHLLGTRLSSESAGSRSLPTPRAEQLTSRWIPSGQLDFDLSGNTSLKNFVFYDAGYIRTEDPDHSFGRARNHSSRLGTSHALTHRNWKALFSIQKNEYQSLTFSAPSETLLNGLVAHRWDFSILEVQPEAGFTQNARQGFFPHAALGVRKKLDPWVFSGKGSYSRKFPTISDRYYVDAFYVGNPNLTPEKDWTGIAAVRFQKEKWSIGLTGFYQEREKTLVFKSLPSSFTLTRVNGRGSRVASLTLDGKQELISGLDSSQKLVFTYSRMEETGLQYPYLPRWTFLKTLRVYPASDPEARELSLLCRAQTRAVASTTGTEVAGYVYFDVGTRVRLFKSGVFVALNIENIFDRIYESVLDYPVEGRTLSGSLQASF